MKDSCVGCKHYLKGAYGFCAINGERECADNERELYEKKDGEEDPLRGKAFFLTAYGITSMFFGIVLYKLWNLVF